MKTARIDHFGERVNIVEEEIPKPQHDEILVELKACGFCHTDIHAIEGDWSVKPKLPLTPGHEGVGYVKEVGSDVRNVKVGDYVGVPWLYSTCGSCEYCNSGWETLCSKQRNSGYNVDGCFRNFTVIPATHAVIIPPELSPEEAAPLLCAGVTSYKALKEAEARPGQFVCILGAGGGLGHLAVQYSKAMGYRTIALDIGQEKLDYCLSLGAEQAIEVDQKGPNVADQVRAVTEGGAHAVLVIATHPSAYALALDICRPKGTIVCVSMPKDSMVHLDMVKIVLHRITLRGTIVGTRQDMLEALDFAKRGLVKCHVSTQPLEQVNEVMDNIVHNRVVGRIVLTM
eukprot:gene11431-12780_t